MTPPARPNRVRRFLDSFLEERGLRWLLATGVILVLGSAALLADALWNAATPAWQGAILLAVTVATASLARGAARLGLARTSTALHALFLALVPILGLASGLAERPESAFLVRSSIALLSLLTALRAGPASFRFLLGTSPPSLLFAWLGLSASGALLPPVEGRGAVAATIVLWSIFAAGTVKANRHVFWETEYGRRPRIFGFFPIALLGAQFVTLFLLRISPGLEYAWYGFAAVLTAIPVVLTGDTLHRVHLSRTGGLAPPRTLGDAHSCLVRWDDDTLRPLRLPAAVATPIVVGTVLTTIGIVTAGAQILLGPIFTERVLIEHPATTVGVPTAALGAGLIAFAARRFRSASLA